MRPLPRNACCLHAGHAAVRATGCECPCHDVFRRGAPDCRTPKPHSEIKRWDWLTLIVIAVVVGLVVERLFGGGK